MFKPKNRTRNRASTLAGLIAAIAFLIAGCGHGGSNTASSAVSGAAGIDATSVAQNVDACVNAATSHTSHKLTKVVKCVETKYNLGFLALVHCGDKVLNKLGYTLSIFVTKNTQDQSEFWQKFGYICVFRVKNPGGTLTPTPTPTNS